MEFFSTSCTKVIQAVDFIGAEQSLNVRRLNQCSVGLVDCAFCMLSPGEVLTDSDTQVLATVCYLYCVAVDFVSCIDDLSSVGADSYGAALLGTEFHRPCFFPALLD